MPKISSNTSISEGKRQGESGSGGLFTEFADIVDLSGWTHAVDDNALGGDDRVHLTRYGDSFWGGLGRDEIWGEDGNDIIYETKVYGDEDTLHGGDGIDTISYGYYSNAGTLGKLTIRLDYGYAQVDKPRSMDLLDGFENVIGSQYGDNIFGDGQENALHGGSGADLVSGQGGADFITGDDGNDTLSGGGEDDYILGGQGNDSITGDAGHDYLEGNGGDNTLTGGLGDDYFKIGAGNNYITGDTGDYLDKFGGGFDVVDYRYSAVGLRASFEFPGWNIIVDMNGVPFIPLSVIHGNGVDSFQDTYHERHFVEKIIATSHDDTIVMGSAMSIYAGAGNDTVFGARHDYGDNHYRVFLEEGNDSFSAGGLNYHSTGGSFEIFCGSGDDAVGVRTGVATIHGGDGNDRLQATNGTDYSAEAATIYGDAGNDHISGSKGSDLLHGGNGADEIHAGAGDDTIHGGGTGGFGQDKISGNAGNDLIYTETASGENCTVFGYGGNDTVYGGDGNDFIIANSGDDVIAAGKGTNTVYGDYGIYEPDHGSDIFVFDVAGITSIFDFDNGMDKLSFEGLNISIDDLNIVQANGWVYISHQGGQFKVADVLVTDLDASDFIF